MDVIQDMSGGPQNLRTRSGGYITATSKVVTRDVTGTRRGCDRSSGRTKMEVSGREPCGKGRAM